MHVAVQVVLALFGLLGVFLIGAYIKRTRSAASLRPDGRGGALLFGGLSLLSVALLGLFLPQIGPLTLVVGAFSISLVRALLGRANNTRPDSAD
jgi:hypothetical protein